jgi:hypothetical protein
MNCIGCAGNRRWIFCGKIQKFAWETEKDHEILHSQKWKFLPDLETSVRSVTHSALFIIIIIIIIIIIGIQPLGRSGQRPEFSQATGMVLVRCILGKFLGVACHCFPPFFSCSHFLPPGAFTSATMWEIPAAANIRHGTDGFTPPPKEGALRIFFRP